MMQAFFSGSPAPGLGRFRFAAGYLPCHWERAARAAIAATLAALLHGAALVWYLSRPEPVPATAAAPLPTIELVLAAPPAPVVAPPAPAAPPAPPPKVTKPAEPAKPRPKPKPQAQPLRPPAPQPAETAASAAPAVPAAAAPGPASTPRPEPFIPASSKADYLNNPKPVYPGVARNRRWEGLVLLRVLVTAGGRCGEAAVQRSSGYEILDEAALNAVRQWRFVPATRGGVAQSSWATVPIEFKLQ